MNMNTLLHDFVSDMEGRAEQQITSSSSSSASPGLDRKRKVDHETEEKPAFLDEAAPAVPPSANGDDAEGKMNHLKKSPESDNDSDHRGRKAVKSGNDHAEHEDSSSSAQTSPNDSGLDKPTEGEDQDGDDEVVAVAEDDEAAGAPTARSRDQEPTDTRPPSPPPLPLHRHRPSAGARRTFDNLMADAADASPSSTHRSTVIAAVVVFDGEGRVLLVQEAKPKCRGLWYLPAGRVEVGESPIEGAMREVEEESGLQLEPSGIFSVEYKISKRSGKAWIRYGITGQIVGGSLKTPDREDRESIQARWFPLEEVNESLGLRNDDMLKLIALHRQNGDRPIPVLSSYKS